MIPIYCNYQTYKALCREDYLGLEKESVQLFASTKKVFLKDLYCHSQGMSWDKFKDKAFEKSTIEFNSWKNYEGIFDNVPNDSTPIITSDV
jgi:hypothetical protein